MKISKVLIVINRAKAHSQQTANALKKAFAHATDAIRAPLNPTVR